MKNIKQFAEEKNVTKKIRKITENQTVRKIALITGVTILSAGVSTSTTLLLGRTKIGKKLHFVEVTVQGGDEVSVPFSVQPSE